MSRLFPAAIGHNSTSRLPAVSLKGPTAPSCGYCRRRGPNSTAMTRHGGRYMPSCSTTMRKRLFAAFDAALEAMGFQTEQRWGERIEDRGSQITFSALGQQAPLDAKERWDPDFAKRKVIQAALRRR